MVKTIIFPLDFSYFDNPILTSIKNYIHQREDGSMISVLEDDRYPEVYEVFDQKWMSEIKIMEYSELLKYLEKEPIRNLMLQFSLN